MKNMLKKYGWILFVLMGAAMSVGTVVYGTLHEFTWYQWIMAFSPIAAYIFLFFVSIKRGW